MPDPAVLIAPSLNLARHRTETSGRHDIRPATLALRRLWAARSAVCAPIASSARGLAQYRTPSARYREERTCGAPGLADADMGQNEAHSVGAL